MSGAAATHSPGLLHHSIFLGHGMPGDTFSLDLRTPSVWEIKGSAPLFLQKQVLWSPQVVAGTEK